MTPDPLDPDGTRRIQYLARKGCDCNCQCRQDDAYTTTLQIEDYQ